MQVFLTLLRRELGTYFHSMTGYVIIAAVLGLLGLSVNFTLSALSGEPTDAPMTEVFYSSYFFWLILLLTTPVITMRTFALEKFSGTYETLMTAPVSDLQVALSKFAGAMVFYAITWLPLLGYMVFLDRYLGAATTTLETRSLITTYFGILLIGSVYIGLGCFTSALTRSQLIAAAVSYGVGLTLFLLSLYSLLPARPTGWQAELFRHISTLDHMHDFARGVIDTRSVVYYLSLTTFFIFLTLKAVEARRWK